MQTSLAGIQLSCLGSGGYKDWTDIRVCGEAIINICSARLLPTRIFFGGSPAEWNFFTSMYCSTISRTSGMFNTDS